MREANPHVDLNSSSPFKSVHCGTEPAVTEHQVYFLLFWSEAKHPEEFWQEKTLSFSPLMQMYFHIDSVCASGCIALIVFLNFQTKWTGLCQIQSCDLVLATLVRINISNCSQMKPKHLCYHSSWLPLYDWWNINSVLIL